MAFDLEDLTLIPPEGPLVPVSGTMGGGYGDPRSSGLRKHKGGDLFAPAGTPLIAPGNMEFIQGNKGGTNLNANDWWSHWRDLDTGMEYRFAHHGPINDYTSGQVVPKGEQWGEVGNAIDSPHLHMAVYDPTQGKNIDWMSPVGLKRGTSLSAGTRLDKVGKIAAKTIDLNDFALGPPKGAEPAKGFNIDDFSLTKPPEEITPEMVMRGAPEAQYIEPIGGMVGEILDIPAKPIRWGLGKLYEQFLAPSAARTQQEWAQAPEEFRGTIPEAFGPIGSKEAFVEPLTMALYPSAVRVGSKILGTAGRVSKAIPEWLRAKPSIPEVLPEVMSPAVVPETVAPEIIPRVPPERNIPEWLQPKVEIPPLEDLTVVAPAEEIAQPAAMPPGVAEFMNKFGSRKGAPEGLLTGRKKPTFDLTRAEEQYDRASILKAYGGFSSRADILKNFALEERKKLFPYYRRTAQGPDELLQELKGSPYGYMFEEFETDADLLRGILDGNLKPRHYDELEGYYNAEIAKEAKAAGVNPAEAGAVVERKIGSERRTIEDVGEDYFAEAAREYALKQKPEFALAAKPKLSPFETRLKELQTEFPGIDPERTSLVLRTFPDAENNQIANMVADPEMYAQMTKGNLTAQIKEKLLEKAGDYDKERLLPGAEVLDPTKLLYSGGPSIEDIQKMAAPAIEYAQKVKQGPQSLFFPTTKSPEHLQAAEVLGSKLGSMWRMGESAADNLRRWGKTFDKMGIYDPNTPLPENPGIKFMSDMSVGRPVEFQLTGVASKIKEMFAERLKLLEEAGAPLESVRENYFPGMWEEKGAAANYLAKRPFKGGESFRKPKVFDDIMEGIEAGFTPISKNPIDLVKLKLAEMDRSIMANRALREWEGKGDIINVNNRGIPLKGTLQEDFNPSEWARINDPYGTIWRRNPDTKLPEKIGYRVAKVPVAEIMNNYLTQSLYNNPYFGPAFKGWMGTANALNQSQLGWGSLFHGGFTTIETQVTAGAEILKDIYGVARGNRSLKDLGTTISKYPLASIETGRKGGKILGEWRRPTVDVPVDVPVSQLGNTPENKVASIAKAMEVAGGKTTMDVGLRTQQTDLMLRDWAAGKPIKAALRSPIALSEALMKPVIGWLVPRQKLGVFGEMAGRIMEMHPEATINELRPAFRQAWNRVDARLGQVAYDRYFMNNTAKNVIQAGIRAPGWTGGTIAEVGGAPVDAAKFILEWIKTGKAPENLPDRVAYTISLLGSIMATNGALTYAFTGEKPKGMDYWAFRDGGQDQYGNPTRWLLPSYVKDIYAYWENPGHVIVAKTHPAIGLGGELIRGYDYYKDMFRDPEGTYTEQARDTILHAAKGFEPFWTRGMRKAGEEEGGVMATLQKSPAKVIAPEFGVMPATKAYTTTPATKIMDQYYSLSTTIRTPDKAEIAQAKREVLKQLRKGNDTAARGIVDPLVAAKKMSPDKADQWWDEAEFKPQELRFKRLPLDWQVKVMRKASPEEKQIWEPLFREKVDNASDFDFERLQPEIEKLIGPPSF